MHTYLEIPTPSSGLRGLLISIYIVRFAHTLHEEQALKLGVLLNDVISNLLRRLVPWILELRTKANFDIPIFYD